MPRNPSNPRKFWTPEQDEYLKKWWLAKMAYLIGEELGFTKPAVIGRANRLGLPNKRKALAEMGLLMPVRRDGAQPRRRGERKKRAATTPRYLGLGDTPPTCEPVGFMALRKDQCHSPTDQRGPDGLIMYCGEGVCKRLVKDGLDWAYVDASYCAYHYRLYNKVPKPDDGNQLAETANA